MPTETLTRVYEEGVNKLTIFPINSDGTYGTAYSFEGLMTVDIPFSSTTANVAADDKTNYRDRVSPLKGEGTITVVGMKRADYQALYNNITDTNGALVGGRRNQSKQVGVGFYNTINGETVTAEQYTFLPNVVFSLPNMSHQTIAEDDTTIRPFELAVVANSVNFTTSGGQTDRYAFASVNSIDDVDIYATVKGTAYVPDQEIEAEQTQEQTQEQTENPL